MNNKEVVLITGASRGIGARLALEFSASGFYVIINYLKEEDKARNVLNNIKETGGDGQVYRADVSDSARVRDMVKDIAKSCGRLDVLVNNASIVKNRTVANMSDIEWEDVVKTDLTGGFYAIRECSKVMIEQRCGSIINIASIIGARGQFGAGNYSSAKAGMISLMKTAAKELGTFNIRVNAVLPGFHLTDIGKTANNDYLDIAKHESVLGTTTDMNELSKFIVFLSRAKTVSGQVFNWDSRII